MFLLDEIKAFWKIYVVLLTPVLLLPLLLINPGSESACAYAVLIMAVYWVTEAMPIAVTALLPMVLFPLLGLMPASDVSPNYMRDTNFVFIGGLFAALAVEKSMLHNRIALKVLSAMGTKPKWLILGFMLPTWFLSMWISNTATTAMMIPVAAAVLHQFKTSMLMQEKAQLARAEEKEIVGVNGIANGHVNPAMEISSDTIELEVTHFGDVTPTVVQLVSSDTLNNGKYSEITQPAVVAEEITAPEEEADFQTTEAAAKYAVICKMLSLSVAYAANVGGTATLTGTTPNLVLAGIAEDMWAERGLPPPITWANWIPFGLPIAIICLVVAWLWLVSYFLGVKDFCCCCGSQEHDEVHEERVKKVVAEAYEGLGPMRFDEIASLVLFIILVFLWFARDPGFVPGYAVFFEPGYVSDSVPAMLIGIILFIFPEVWPKSKLLCGLGKGEKARSVPALLNWPLVCQKMPWGPIFIVGGGFAMAEAVEVSGLSIVIAEALEGLGDLHPWLMIFLVTLLTAVLTNITSNTATTTLVLPILAALAEGIGENPLYLMLPATLTASMAFLLPVATPPNAIVFSTGHLKVIDMFLAGAVLNLLCIFVIIIATHTWGMALFDLDTMPWDTNSTVAAF